MNLDLPKSIIEASFAIEIRSQVVIATHRGYQMVERLMDSDPLLSSELVKRNLKGHLRTVAVEFSLDRACAYGALPFTSRTRNNEAKNCLHIELVGDGIILTANRVPYHDSFPRDAIFRDQLKGCTRQTCLGFIPPEPNEGLLENTVYACITHGTRSSAPEFVCIGVPHPAEESWLYRKNLMLEPHLISESDTAPPEDVEEAQVRFKSYIEEKLLDNDKLQHDEDPK